MEKQALTKKGATNRFPTKYRVSSFGSGIDIRRVEWLVLVFWAKQKKENKVCVFSLLFVLYINRIETCNFEKQIQLVLVIRSEFGKNITCGKWKENTHREGSMK